MLSMNIELRHLRYFVAVAEDASFTAAARHVHVTQQVLSTQIRQLETAVGVQLLFRTSRGVELTPAGRAFLTYARETLADVERGVTAARNAAGAVAGRLCVGMTVAASGDMRTRLLTAFSCAYPSVELSLLTFDLSRPAAGLLDHSTDVALVRPPVDAPGIALEVVEEEPRVFVLPQGHPLASHDVLELSDVAGLPWVTTALAVDGCAPERWRDDWLVNPRPASSEVYNARPGLVFVPSKGVPSTALCVAWRADDERPVVRSFVELATSVARDGASEADG